MLEFHGEGFEYVMSLTAAGVLFAGIGGGKWSFDSLPGIAVPPGWPLTVSALAAGCLGAVAFLAFGWRPRALARADLGFTGAVKAATVGARS